MLPPKFDWYTHGYCGSRREGNPQLWDSREHLANELTEMTESAQQQHWLDKHVLNWSECRSTCKENRIPNNSRLVLDMLN